MIFFFWLKKSLLSFALNWFHFWLLFADAIFNAVPLHLQNTLLHNTLVFHDKNKFRPDELIRSYTIKWINVEHLEKCFAIKAKWLLLQWEYSNCIFILPVYVVHANGNELTVYGHEIVRANTCESSNSRKITSKEMKTISRLQSDFHALYHHSKCKRIHMENTCIINEL